MNTYECFINVIYLCESVLYRMETCGAALCKQQGYGERVLLAQLCPQLNLFCGEYKDNLYCGVYCVKAFKGEHYNRLSAKQLELLGHLSAHACALASGNDNKVFLHVSVLLELHL